MNYVPFDKNGNMLGYKDFYSQPELELPIDTEFQANMKYLYYGRGRSSIKLYFKDLNTNKEYEMFISEFDRLMKKELIDSKQPLCGIWGFHKKGKNYGLRFIRLQ